MQQSVVMFDAILLTEEELRILFGPTSHEVNGTITIHQPRNNRISTHIASTQSDHPKVKSSSTYLRPSLLKVFGCGIVPGHCGYRTGKCPNLQAIKRNGRLHKLCEFHRERANINQKKLDRKKRMQRFKLSDEVHSSCKFVSPASSVNSEDDSRCIGIKTRSPRTVEATVTSSIFTPTDLNMEHDELDTELLLPTSLQEAPLTLCCEELAIFCSLMTFDVNQHVPPLQNPSLVRTPLCHYPTSTV